MGGPTTTRLYWSERGAIACIDHAPYRGSDTWVWERWRAMRPQEVTNFTSETGNPPSCECCGVDTGPQTEGTEMTKPKKTAKTKPAKRTSSKSRPAAAAAAMSPQSTPDEAGPAGGTGEDLMVFAFRLPKSLSAKFHDRAGAGKASKVARELVEQYVNQPAGEAS